jgi:hypothetical protein
LQLNDFSIERLHCFPRLAKVRNIKKQRIQAAILLRYFQSAFDPLGERLIIFIQKK